MQMPQAKRPAARLEGLDLARYVAFVGMVIVNFKIAMGADADAVIGSGTGSGTGMAHALTAALEGRAAATFVVLAGIGLGLAGLKGLDQTVPVTIKRAVFLLVIGLLNMTIFDADILHYYAFYFLFGAALLPLRTRTLIWGVLGLNLLFVVGLMILDYDAGWDWDSYTYSGFWTVSGFVRNLFFNGWHPVVPWLGFLVFGIVLSRISLDARGTQLRLVAGGAVALALVEGISAVLTPLMARIDPELVALVGTDPVPPVPFYFVAGCGAACIVVGLCLLMADRMRRIGLLAVFGPAGRQTLTLYIAHVLIGMGTLEALGMLGGQSVGQAVWASAVFCVCATVYAMIWARWFKRGPIEALMRKIAG